MEAVPVVVRSPGTQESPPQDFWNPVSDIQSRLDALSDALQDYWQPTITSDFDTPESRDAQTSDTYDFWSLDDITPATKDAAHDWGAEAALPWFDHNLADNPYIVDDSPSSAPSIAERRSRWLVQLLDIPEERRRVRFAAYFQEVFELFPFQQTFISLSELAVDGVAAESVLNGCAFRLAFLQTPKLASRRAAGMRLPYPYHEPASLLSWKRAVRLSELCQGCDPSDLLDDDWYNEWLALCVDDALYWSYLDYIEWRFASSALGYWALELSRSRSEWTDAGLVYSLTTSRSFSRAGGLYRGQTDVIGSAHPYSRTPQRLFRSTRGSLDTSHRLLGPRELLG